jgi:hypothetical protein
MAIVREAADGAILAVKVVPGASRDRLVGPLGSRLKISVRKPPEKGEANRAARELVAKAAGVRLADVEVVAGHTRPEKDFLVRGVSAAALRQSLQI